MLEKEALKVENKNTDVYHENLDPSKVIRNKEIFGTDYCIIKSNEGEDIKVNKNGPIGYFK